MQPPPGRMQLWPLSAEGHLVLPEAAGVVPEGPLSVQQQVGVIYLIGAAVSAQHATALDCKRGGNLGCVTSSASK